VVFVFVYRCGRWSPPAFSGGLAQLGHLMNVPSHPTAGNVSAAWHLGVSSGLWNSIIVVVVGLSSRWSSARSPPTPCPQAVPGRRVVMLAIWRR